MTDKGRRTVLVCFDGLSFDYLDRFDLANFSALRSQGVECPLESTFPPWTGSAWPSLYSGTDPGTHGVFDFFAFDSTYPEHVEVATRNDVKVPAIWNYLSARDIPSLVLNMPVTYPAEPINGVLIPGYLSPEDAAGQPDGIRDELAAKLGEYHIYSRVERGVTDTHSVSDYVDLIDHRRRAATHLLESQEWELAVLQVQKTDAVFHNFNDEAAFERVYDAADEFLGHVVETVGPETNIVVCSDHGIGPTTGYRIYLNQILADKGYLEPTAKRSSLPKLGVEKERLTDDGPSSDDTDESGLATKAFAVAASGVQRAGISLDAASTVADRIGILPLITQYFADEIRTTLERGVDWRASTAYCRSGNELGVRLNVAGREPDGVVPTAEYETVRTDLIDLLSGLETPAGEPAFESVRPREAVYQGPHAEDACDILVRPTDMNNTIATNLMGVQFVGIDDHDHKRQGTFIGAGPGFETDTAVSTLSLVDVAPIVFSLLGRPVPERMTGDPPDELLATPLVTEPYGHVPFGVESTERNVDEHVKGHLDDLGYLG